MATRVVAIPLRRLACPLLSLGLPGSQEHTGQKDRQAQIHIHIVSAHIHQSAVHHAGSEVLPCARPCGVARHRPVLIRKGLYSQYLCT